ncbi:MAG: NupC/NupG family nucleoside CNT transporter [Candidatus Hydrogenedentes bacterium]|nr:NupC/NupG family nucleoside CNT transporter [Candidatus Hydrogenedentota bacterium]
MPRLTSALGLLILIGIAWALSERRKAIPWRLVVWGLALQFVLALLILTTPLRTVIFAGMQRVVGVLTDSAVTGASFVFGSLAENPEQYNTFFAFRVLPVIIFVSALSAILYHLRVIPALVAAIAWMMRRTLKTSGAETFGAALLIFLGIESTSAIRTYLKEMTRSELCTIMTTFMATIAGSVMVTYASFGAEPGHLLTASLMSAPAAILISKILVPETGEPKTVGHAPVRMEVDSRNLIDAATQGTSQGLTMALQVAAMVLVFVGLIYMLDLATISVTGRSFVDLLSYAFRPFAFLLGVPPQDIPEVSALLGKKTVLNEFLAYLDLKEMIAAGTLSERGKTIATYALCGFANPGSMAISIAALDALAPERRVDISQLAVKSFIGGTLACFMTACVAGIVVYA